MFHFDMILALKLPNNKGEGTKEVRKHGSGELVSCQPPEGFGVSPSAAPMQNFFGRYDVLVIVDNSADKIMSNAELGILVGALLTALAIIFMPF